MYGMMTRWDKAAQTLPTVVARLQVAIIFVLVISFVAIQ
jgi:hypothetical protein